MPNSPNLVTAASSNPDTGSMPNGADLSWVSSLIHSSPKSPQLLLAPAKIWTQLSSSVS